MTSTTRHGDSGDNLADEASLGRLDASYTPIEPFSAWVDTHIRVDDWIHALRQLEEAKGGVSGDDLRLAVEVAMRAAAIDTGAIEGLYEVDRGFTFSVALQSTAWQITMRDKGEAVRPLFEAQLHAYELALDAATSSVPVTEAWIRHLHEVICGPQESVTVLTSQGWQDQALLKGAYKQLPNHVRQADGTIFTYAPVADTPAEMQRLVEELRTASFEAAHPTLQAAYAHYQLVRIHPFQDGNGRVARALASISLYRAASVPLVVFADDAADYLRSLRAADRGDRAEFATFLLVRAADTMQLIAERLSGRPQDRLEQLQRVLTARGGLSHTELDRVGYGIQKALAEEFTAQLSGLSVPAGVLLQAHPQNQQYGATSLQQFRPLLSEGPQVISLFGQVSPPGQASVAYIIRVLVSQVEESPHAFRVIVENGTPFLDVRLEDVYPQERSFFKLRVSGWVRKVIDTLIGELTRSAQISLRGNGYS